MAAVQKVALITAGTAGLGAAVARALAPDFRVAINYANNAQRAQAVVDELQKVPLASGSSDQQPRFAAIQADVGDRQALQHLVSETISKFGRLDVVVSNAGWTRITNFANLDEALVDDDWEKCLRYNVKAHLWLCHAARAELEKHNGAFITTASLAGIKPSGSSLAYSVTKAGLIHLSKALAIICAPGIRVNSVSPGLILTEWGMKFSEERREAAREATKLKRLATIEDCADAIRMLATSSSITGQNIPVDGGSSV